MGEQRVSLLSDKDQMNRFVKQLLADVRSLSYMIDNDWFESGITRMGAEQEMCLVDSRSFKPVPFAMKALKKMKSHEWVETELAKFNLETNLTPRELTGTCLSDLEAESIEKLDIIRTKLEKLDSKLVLTGILPTLRLFHLNMNNLTPKKRYFALMEAINKQLNNNSYELRLMGIDELLIKHDSPMLEACNTSFQVHLQVSPENFVHMYNIAQALTGPVMAIAANSPIVFGRRLWHESRIALFQQALDTRSSAYHMRERSPRVNFGNGWLKDSLLEIYQEDISRFRVLIAGDIEEDSEKMIRNNEVPKLRALQVHNSTVYRWNRPCYGISPNGKPHLRIENRVLPSGPTVIDEVSNAAFWLGCMLGLANKVSDVREHISWEDVRDNFGKAAKFGIDTKFTWFDDKKISAVDLVLNYLLPIAREGLISHGVNEADINKYLNIIEERAKAHNNGARWQLRAYTKLIKETSRDEALSCLTASIIKNQEQEIPVHKWALPDLTDLDIYDPSTMLVEEFMYTDVFTTHRNDIVQLVSDMMNWKGIHYAPVENKKGEIVGLVTSQLILKYFNSIKKQKKKEYTLVEEIMIEDPITTAPESTIVEAMEIMKKYKIGCLPVVKEKELVGIITEMDFIQISNRLIERSQNKTTFKKKKSKKKKSKKKKK
jgi:CBS domain-containing protein/gamma-glutamylcysteine synthetase